MDRRAASASSWWSRAGGSLTDSVFMDLFREVVMSYSSARMVLHNSLDLNRLLPEIYDERRRLAERAMRGQPRDHTLQPTALVHEAYLKLAGSASAPVDRTHLLATAARAMRQILVD